MKTITPEIKQIIFALYWGQVIKGCFGWPKYDDNTKVTRVREVELIAEQDYLLLPPLSQITDEDAIECAKLLGWFVQTGEYEVYKNHFGQTVVSSSPTDFKYHRTVIAINELIPIQMDFLRSRGYALPYLSWSVEELIAVGIYKLKLI